MDAVLDKEMKPSSHADIVAHPKTCTQCTTPETHRAMLRLHLILFWVTSVILLVLVEVSFAGSVLAVYSDDHSPLFKEAESKLKQEGSSLPALLELSAMGQYLIGGLIGGFVSMIYFTPTEGSEKNLTQRLLAKWTASGLFSVGIAPKLTDLSVKHWSWEANLSTIMFWSSLWGALGVFIVHDVAVPIFELGVKKGIIEICHAWARRFGAKDKTKAKSGDSK